MNHPRGTITVRHRLTPAQAVMVRDHLAHLWPGYDVEVEFARQWWRPWRRGLSVRVVHG